MVMTLEWNDQVCVQRIDRRNNRKTGTSETDEIGKESEEKEAEAEEEEVTFVEPTTED